MIFDNIKIANFKQEENGPAIIQTTVRKNTTKLQFPAFQRLFPPLFIDFGCGIGQAGRINIPVIDFVIGCSKAYPEVC